MSDIARDDEKKDNKERANNRMTMLRRGMDAFGNMFALNLCFVVGCIPVVTIGASLSALYAMCIRLQEDEEETVVAGFIHEYKRSFKQATLAFLLLLAILFVMWGEWLLIQKDMGTVSTFYKFVLMIEGGIVALDLPFLFPLIARYNNTLKVSVRNSMVLAITYLWSWAKMAVAWFVPIAICVRWPVIFACIWYLWLLLLFGAIAWGTTHTVRYVFRMNEQRMADYEEKQRKAKEEAATLTEDE